jgi:hypothetical protein
MTDIRSMIFGLDVVCPDRASERHNECMQSDRPKLASLSLFDR